MSRKFGWHSGVAKAKMLELAPTAAGEIASPKAGDIIYDSASDKLLVYTGSAWETVTSA